MIFPLTSNHQINSNNNVKRTQTANGNHYSHAQQQRRSEKKSALHFFNIEKCLWILCKMNQWEVSRAVAYIHVDKKARTRKERECGIYLFIEGHECRVQHSVGMHKHRAAKYEISGVLLRRLLLFKWTTTFHIHSRSNRMSKKAATTFPRHRERERVSVSKAQCLKQHVEGETSKQNFVWKAHTLAFANQTKRWKRVYIRMACTGTHHFASHRRTSPHRVHIELEWSLKHSEEWDELGIFDDFYHSFSAQNVGRLSSWKKYQEISIFFESKWKFSRINDLPKLFLKFPSFLAVHSTLRSRCFCDGSEGKIGYFVCASHWLWSWFVVVVGLDKMCEFAMFAWICLVLWKRGRKRERTHLYTQMLCI